MSGIGRRASDAPACSGIPRLDPAGPAPPACSLIEDSVGESGQGLGPAPDSKKPFHFGSGLGTARTGGRRGQPPASLRRLCSRASLSPGPPRWGGRLPRPPSQPAEAGAAWGPRGSFHARPHPGLGSGPRYMIRVTLFCTLRESENTRTCENCTRNVF